MYAMSPQSTAICIVILLCLACSITSFKNPTFSHKSLFKCSYKLNIKQRSLSIPKDISRRSRLFITFPWQKDKTIDTDIVPEDEDVDKDTAVEVNKKPWRANKKKYLTYHYMSWTDNWRERYLTAEDMKDTIYFYTLTSFKPQWVRIRQEDVWYFPYLWTKTKAERFAWLTKLFFTECERLTVQEHMEMDAFFSEFDMPARWGYLRVFEINFFVVLILNLAFWTDFNGITPTDIGLRPDGAVKTCPVEVYDCISSSNDPRDADHYAPPIKWSRSKSPEQAYDEVKNVYLNYPKRGLRWTYGWIDRGGWRPQEFSGSYFHAEADSILFHFTDDVELVLDYNKRELYYRSETRFRRQFDWDLQRQRYNQFVRMLKTKGGWEAQPMEKLNYFYSIPYRFTEDLLDKSLHSLENSIKSSKYGSSYENLDKNLEEKFEQLKQVIDGLYDYIYPYIRPVITNTQDVYDTLRYDPRVSSALKILQDLEDSISTALENKSELSPDLNFDAAIEQIYKLFPERLDSISIDEGPSLDSQVRPKVMNANPSGSIKDDISDKMKEESKKYQSIEPQKKSSDFKRYLEYFRNEEASKAAEDKDMRQQTQLKEASIDSFRDSPKMVIPGKQLRDQRSSQSKMILSSGEESTAANAVEWLLDQEPVEYPSKSYVVSTSRRYQDAAFNDMNLDETQTNENRDYEENYMKSLKYPRQNRLREKTRILDDDRQVLEAQLSSLDETN